MSDEKSTKTVQQEGHIEPRKMSEWSFKFLHNLTECTGERDSREKKRQRRQRRAHRAGGNSHKHCSTGIAPGSEQILRKNGSCATSESAKNPTPNP